MVLTAFAHEYQNVIFVKSNTKSPPMTRFLLTLALAGTLALPVFAQSTSSQLALTSFNAIPRGQQVLLSWNPDKAGVLSYQLEKSKNGNDYVSFGEVQGTQNITEFLETDFQPYAGLSYYRLRLTDASGAVSYSNVVPVKYNENGEAVSPVASEYPATLTPEQEVLVVVRNAAGEEFYSKVEVETSGNPMQCKDGDPTLNSGTYTIVGCSDQQFYCKQMIVQ